MSYETGVRSPEGLYLEPLLDKWVKAMGELGHEWPYGSALVPDRILLQTRNDQSIELHRPTFSSFHPATPEPREDTGYANTIEVVAMDGDVLNVLYVDAQNPPCVLAIAGSEPTAPTMSAEAMIELCLDAQLSPEAARSVVTS